MLGPGAGCELMVCWDPASSGAGSGSVGVGDAWLWGCVDAGRWHGHVILSMNPGQLC